MGTYNQDVMDREMILYRIKLLNRDSSRIYSDAENLTGSAENDFREIKRDVNQLNHSLDSVVQSILDMIRGSEGGSRVLLEAEDEVTKNLLLVKSNLDRIAGILDPNARLCN